MFVRQLIGRIAGQVIDLPPHVAQAMLDNGTAAKVTDAEIEAAGHELPPPPAETVPMFPEGYDQRTNEGGTFDVYLKPIDTDASGAITSVPLNANRDLPNLAAARSFAVQHAEAAAAAVVQAAQQDAAAQAQQAEAQARQDAIPIPDAWEQLNAEDAKALAVALGATATPATKALAFDFIDAVLADREARSVA